MTNTGEEKGLDVAGTSTTTTTTIDHMSPYYIHASNNPGQIYVSETLHDGNYGDRVNEMSNALFVKNKFGFVDGSIPMPDEGSSDLMQWKRCNVVVKGWLSSAMEKEIRNSIRYAKTAAEVWGDLEERFGKGSAPRAYKLKRALTSTRHDKLPVSAYYTKLRGLWDEIRSIAPMPKYTCGRYTCDISKQLTTLREKEQLYEFLMGLDEIFGTVKSQILRNKPTPTLGTAYHLVAEDEQQRQITTTRISSVEATAFQAHLQPRLERDHQRNEREQPDQRGGRRERPKCTNCGRIGHSVEACYCIIGYPASYKRVCQQIVLNVAKKV